MRRAWWIFGGTAVGKKRFIRCCVERGDTIGLGIPVGVHPVWFDCGPASVSEFLKATKKNDVIIRWQHEREKKLQRLIEDGGLVEHRIVVLIATAHAREERAERREGFRRWTALELHREGRLVEELAERTAREHGLSIQYVDVSETIDRLVGTDESWRMPCESTV